MITKSNHSVVSLNVARLKTIALSRTRKHIMTASVIEFGSAGMFMSNAPTPSYKNIVNIQYAPFYRVLLHYSRWEQDKVIASTVHQAVPIVRMNECVRIVENARLYGKAIVMTTDKEEAEVYCSRLVMRGLDSSIEEA